MEKELDFVFMWAIEGLHDFMLTEEVYLSEECKETLKDYRMLIDNVRDFIEQNYTITASIKDYQIYKELYEDYVEWCRDENISPHKKKNFGQQLLQIKGLLKEKITAGFIIRGLSKKIDAPF